MKPLVGLLALGCAAFASAQTVMGLPESSSNVRFQTVSSGTNAKTNAPGLYVLNEPVGWENYWRAHHNGPMPQLENGFFYRWRLVAVHAGNRPSGGYGLGVTRIQRNIDKALISAIEFTPPRNARNTMAITSPWILLRVETGAFDFNLQTQKVVGYPAGAQVVGGGSTTMKIGGATITIVGGCDHCGHRGRGGCRCDRHGRGCDCRD
ncbi:protease complex subunit PrcB family protein [bacterium]|nr:MAG: protease complex subunit PrcB family protein [bacterium]